MFDQKDILTVLQSGVDPQALANDFADALNGAIKAQADAKAAEAANSDKVETLECILNDVFDFFEKFYPELYDEDVRDAIKAADVAKACDEAYEATIKMKPVFDDLEKVLGDLFKDDAPAPAKKEVKHLDPLDAFLRSNGLKS
ncbi:MAG: hypothetical protein MJ053_07605 [Elusimicrobiaceae bacterium]|nr:hypothetical protein [Elusimicrobiaceae bacterium]